MRSCLKPEDKWLWRGIGPVYLLFVLAMAFGGRGIGILASVLIVCLLGQLWMMHVRRELFSPRNLGGFTLLALIALLGCVFVAITEGLM
jgi:hypothetical protein